jgi:hypothetical protein
MLFAARHISIVPTQKLAVGGNLSTMAFALSFVIAAKLAYPCRHPRSVDTFQRPIRTEQVDVASKNLATPAP